MGIFIMVEVIQHQVFHQDLMVVLLQDLMVRYRLLWILICILLILTVMGVVEVIQHQVFHQDLMVLLLLMQILGLIMWGIRQRLILVILLILGIRISIMCHLMGLMEMPM
jgi:hypothetical protein